MVQKKNIPKIIHYCWFGGNPLPQFAKKCIASWRKYFPEYEIIEWNESNFDVNIIFYTQEAYTAKKFAFVSDYARFWILYRYGGLYFDTDVEVIKPLDDIIAHGSFMGLENDGSISGQEIAVAPGLGLGAQPGLELYKEILNLYGTLSFKKNDGSLNLKTVVEYTTDLLLRLGMKKVSDVQMIGDIYVYPVDYFCPISVANGKLRITSNTRTIHHYAQSWQSPARKYGRKLILFFGGEKLKILIKKIIYKSGK